MNGTVTRLRTHGVEATMSGDPTTLPSTTQYQIYRPSTPVEVVIGQGLGRPFPDGRVKIDQEADNQLGFPGVQVGDLVRTL